MCTSTHPNGLFLPPLTCNDATLNQTPTKGLPTNRRCDAGRTCEGGWVNTGGLGSPVERYWALVGHHLPMPSKPKKPPIDKKAIRARLERAQREVLLARARRWIPEADPVDGYVLDIGREWALFATQTQQVTPDGWTLVRLKDIQAIVLEPIDGSFTTDALRARGQWPPTNPAAELGLDDAHTAVLTAAAAGPLLTVHAEFSRPYACWIGVPISVDDGWLKLREVGVAGNWLTKPRRFDLDDITLLEFGGGYEEALHLVAGAPEQPASPALLTD